MGRADLLTTVSIRRSRPSAVVMVPSAGTIAPGAEESVTGGAVPGAEDRKPAAIVQQHLDADLADDLDDAVHQAVAGNRGPARLEHTVQCLAATRGLVHLVGDERRG